MRLRKIVVNAEGPSWRAHLKTQGKPEFYVMLAGII